MCGARSSSVSVGGAGCRGQTRARDATRSIAIARLRVDQPAVIRSGPAPGCFLLAARARARFPPAANRPKPPPPFGSAPPPYKPAAIERGIVVAHDKPVGLS